MSTLDTMRKALKALKSATPTRRMSDDGYVETGWEEHIAAMLALRAEIARLEAAEPVAWMRPDNRVAEESYARTQFSRGADKPPIGTWVPLYTAPTPPSAAEPVAGWKLVPVEPTFTMEAAARTEANRYHHADEAYRSAIYRAMLAAAPAAPTPPAAIPALNPIEYELAGELPDKTSWAIIAHWAYALAAERAGVGIKEEGK